MSRMAHTSARRPRAVSDRPATDTRLLPIPYPRLDHSLGWSIPLALSGVEACPEPRRRGSQERNGRGLLPTPFPPTTLHINTHYKRCPKALRLRLRSDQSPSRPLHGRSPDKKRHPLSRGHCQVRAPLTRRKGFAPSGDAPEHGVMSPPWAIAPLPDSPVAAFGEADLLSGGRGSPLPFLRMVEHFWWSRTPHSEMSSLLHHILSEVRGCPRAVTDVKPPLRRTPPIGTMAGHFWWSRTPHSEISSLLFHILSEVRGCRRAVADVDRPQGWTTPIAAGVAGIMRKRPGPSTTPTGEPVRPRRIIPSLLPSNELEAEVGVKAPASASVLLSPSPLKSLRVEDAEDAPGRAPLA